MLRLVLIILLINQGILKTFAQSQTQFLDLYTASNEVVYKAGDNIKLGFGSSESGQFLHIKKYKKSKNNSFSPREAGRYVKIKKIFISDEDEILFLVLFGNNNKYILNIEKAIESCEIDRCKMEGVFSNSINFSAE